jgi:hypothetical protein
LAEIWRSIDEPQGGGVIRRVFRPAKCRGLSDDCDITSKTDRQFRISDRIVLVFSETGEVVVADQVILHVGGLPTKAWVARNTDRKMDSRWTGIPSN